MNKGNFLSANFHRHHAKLPYGGVGGDVILPSFIELVRKILSFLAVWSVQSVDKVGAILYSFMSGSVNSTFFSAAYFFK